MNDPRHTIRTWAMQCLCHLDAQGEESLPLLGRLLEGHDLRAEEAVQCEALARNVWRHHAELDAMIESASRNWSLGRMSPVDRSIIRLAAYELRFGAGVPRAVAIDEAIRLAKEFGTGESASFVNGVLDALNRPAGEAAPDESAAAGAAGAPGEKE